MKDIDLVKLKELAQRYSDSFSAHKSDPTSPGKVTAWDCATHEFSEAIGHNAEDIVCMLIEQLEAAQREQDEYRQRLDNAEYQLEMAELAKFNLRAQRKAQFRKRKAAETELKRRDELEPDYILYQCGCCGHETTDRMTRCPKCNHEPVAQKPLYDAAPAARNRAEAEHGN